MGLISLRLTGVPVKFESDWIISNTAPGSSGSKAWVITTLNDGMFLAKIMPLDTILANLKIKKPDKINYKDENESNSKSDYTPPMDIVSDCVRFSFHI